MNTVMHTNLERAVETTPARTIDDSIEAAVEAAERMLGISLDREWIIASVIDAGITADDESDDVARATWKAVSASVLAGKSVCSTSRDTTDSIGNPLTIGSAIAYPEAEDDLPMMRHGIVSDIEHRDYGVIAIVKYRLDSEAAGFLGAVEVDRTIAVTINHI